MSGLGGIAICRTESLGGIVQATRMPMVPCYRISCVKCSVVITNTVFQQANKFKASWMHPRSKHWHLIDHVLVRQCDLQNSWLTHIMCPTIAWSDHRMVCTTVLLTAKPVKRKHWAAPRRKLDITKSDDICLALQQELARALSSDDTDQWPEFKATAFNTAAKVIRYRKTRHKDWFNEQDSEARTLLDDMHEKHLICMNDKSNSAKKSVYIQARGAAQRRLRQILVKETWWSATAELLQTVTTWRPSMMASRQCMILVYSSSHERWQDTYHKLCRHSFSLGRTISQCPQSDNHLWPFCALTLLCYHSYQPGIQTMSSFCLLTGMFSGQSIRCPLVKHQDQMTLHRNCSSGGGPDIIDKLVAHYQSIRSSRSVP